MRRRNALAAANVAVLASVMFAVFPASAQGPSSQAEMTVDELVARALADNPDLRAARREIDAALGRLRQAGLRPNPMLELGGQKALSPDNNLTAMLTFPLDLNGRKEGRVAVAERELAMKRAQVGDRERRLRGEVRMKAGEVLAAQRNLRVTDGLLQVNRQALGIVQERVKQGAAPALEENLALVEVNRLDASQKLLASRVEVATLQLRALDGRADLQAARADAAASRARILKEQAEGRWDASVNLGYMRQDFGFDLMGSTAQGQTRPIQDVFHYFGGGVSIMLPVRNRNQGNIAAARAEADAAERRVEFATLTVRQEVEAAFVQYEAARRGREIYERGVRDIARRNLDVVRQSYELGRGSLLDVVAEQRRYIETENGYTDALKQVYDAAVEIERTVGARGR